MGGDAGGKPAVRMVTIGENNDGQRIDNFLMGYLKGVPRSWVYRVLRRGEVRVNRGRCKPTRRLRIGDIVRIPPLRTEARPSGTVPERLSAAIEAAVIYENDELLIVNKPSGLAVHGGSGVSFGVIEALRAARPNAPFLELAHRLDRDTSGCLMLAKKRSALRRLQELQRCGQVEKHYLALLCGRIRKGAWRADRPLRKNTLKSGERVVRVDPMGKPSATAFRTLKRYADTTLVEATLETGRTHQIRVHAASDGWPIAGDDKYGDEDTNKLFRPRGLRRLFLHAASLHFDWPNIRGGLRIEAALPDELQAFLQGLDQ